jgi:UPF0755 protein
MQENQNTFSGQNWREKTRTFFSDEKNRKKVIAFLVALVVAIFISVIISPPADFPSGKVVTVSDGESLEQITTALQNAHIIRSSFIFRSAVILFGGERKVVASDYLLKKPESALLLAYRFAFGKTNIALIKITIPEGWNSKQISTYLATHLPNLDQVKFQDIANRNEGYLFPDTYFVSPLITPELLMTKMQDNFFQKVASVSQIKTFGKPFYDIVIMASMLEDEARTTADRQIVAGILWKRLSLGMPLQVDSTIAYVTGKSLTELTASDLKIKSPYNTYLYKGLPPGPVGNPGLDALTSAVTPTTTNYLYYLSDKDGLMHYATTFVEHQKNIAKYLK